MNPTHSSLLALTTRFIPVFTYDFRVQSATQRNFKNKQPVPPLLRTTRFCSDAVTHRNTKGIPVHGNGATELLGTTLLQLQARIRRENLLSNQSRADFGAAMFSEHLAGSYLRTWGIYPRECRTCGYAQRATPKLLCIPRTNHLDHSWNCTGRTSALLSLWIWLPKSFREKCVRSVILVAEGCRGNTAAIENPSCCRIGVSWSTCVFKVSWLPHRWGQSGGT